MQNILFVHHSNDLYGADIVLLETIKHLDRALFTPLVILPADSQHIGRLAPRLVEANAEAIFLPLAVMRRKYFKPGRVAGYIFELSVRSVASSGSAKYILSTPTRLRLRQGLLLPDSQGFRTSGTCTKFLWIPHPYGSSCIA
jgi:hypothetical protein